MKVLYICEEYPPGKNGGIGTMVRNLGRALVSQGHQVYVVGVYPHGYGQSDYEEDQGVKVWRFRLATNFSFMRGNFNFIEKVILKLFRTTGILEIDLRNTYTNLFQFIQSLVEKEKIDIIEMPDWNTYLHQAKHPVPVPMFSAPLVVKFHGSYSYFNQEMKLPIDPTIYRAEKALLERADALCSVSRYTAAVTQQLYKLNQNISVLYNGIPIKEADLTTTYDENKVIFTGTLVKKKGIFSLIKAWNLVHKMRPEASLHIYGKGAKEALLALLDEKSRTTVHFHGHVHQDHLYKELASAALAVFPSYSECFALAPLEAMAAGTAVIVSKRSSGPELIEDHINGLLTDPDDIETMASQILELLTSKTIRNQLAVAGNQLIHEKFTITESAKEHTKFYQDIIQTFRRKNQ